MEAQLFHFVFYGKTIYEAIINIILLRLILYTKCYYNLSMYI